MREFLAFRESLGMTILPLTGGGDVFALSAGRSPERGLVPLLADRDLTDNGVEVDLCGHRARMAAGPAALALMTRAPLLHPVSIRYERLEPAQPEARASSSPCTTGSRCPTTGTTRDKAWR